jgi:hypothetical protein
MVVRSKPQDGQDRSDENRRNRQHPERYQPLEGDHALPQARSTPAQPNGPARTSTGPLEQRADQRSLDIDRARSDKQLRIEIIRSINVNELIEHVDLELLTQAVQGAEQKLRQRLNTIERFRNGGAATQHNNTGDERRHNNNDQRQSSSQEEPERRRLQCCNKNKNNSGERCTNEAQKDRFGNYLSIVCLECGKQCANCSTENRFAPKWIPDNRALCLPHEKERQEAGGEQQGGRNGRPAFHNNPRLEGGGREDRSQQRR